MRRILLQLFLTLTSPIWGLPYLAWGCIGFILDDLEDEKRRKSRKKLWNQEEA
jgi:hypothetical protein